MRIHEIITELSEADTGLTFNGLPCTKDCSGNLAGFLKARRDNITNPDQCGTNNGHLSFKNACRKNAADQRDGKYKITPPVRHKGKFQKFQPTVADPRKYHQKKMSEPRPEQNKPDSHTPGY
jgi:hypothetical protein